MNRSDVIEKFNAIINSHSMHAAWLYFELDFSEFTEEEEIMMDLRMLKETWHELHEDLVSGVQLHRNPLIEDALYEVAVSSSYNVHNPGPLARKCTWALADIGTERAKQLLIEISKNGSEEVAGYANKRLNSWDEELSRKGRVVYGPGDGALIHAQLYRERSSTVVDEPNVIFACQSQDLILIYVALPIEMSNHAIKEHLFTGIAFDDRIYATTSFLGMMKYTSWIKENVDTRVLALWISVDLFRIFVSKNLNDSCTSKACDDDVARIRNDNFSEVKLISDYDPIGEEIPQRKTLDLYLNCNDFKMLFSAPKGVRDVTRYAQRQYLYVERDQLQNLALPIEMQFDLFR